MSVEAVVPVNGVVRSGWDKSSGAPRWSTDSESRVNFCKGFGSRLDRPPDWRKKKWVAIFPMHFRIDRQSNNLNFKHNLVPIDGQISLAGYLGKRVGWVGSVRSSLLTVEVEQKVTRDLRPPNLWPGLHFQNMLPQLLCEILIEFLCDRH